MSAFPDQPFNEFEERYFLAEILKKSALPAATLVNLIREAGIEPAWTEIALPNGRSLSSCQHAYNVLLARTQQQQQQQQLPQQPPPILMAPQDPTFKRFKRPYSMGSMTDVPSPITRELQPRPPVFPPPNGQQPPATGPVTMSPVEPPRKKRGRPTKSEFEKRQAEAKERGEVWPKPRKNPKTQKPSSQGTEAGGSSLATTGSIGIAEHGTEGGAGVSAGSGEESSVQSAPGTGLMYPPSTPVSATHMSPASQRRTLPYEGMMQPAGQASQDDPRSEGDTTGGPRMSQFQLAQPLPGSMRTHGPPIPEGPGLQRGPPGHVPALPPYSPHLSHHQFPGYHVDERPPGPRQS